MSETTQDNLPALSLFKKLGFTIEKLPVNEDLRREAKLLDVNSNTLLLAVLRHKVSS